MIVKIVKSVKIGKVSKLLKVAKVALQLQRLHLAHLSVQNLQYRLVDLGLRWTIWSILEPAYAFVYLAQKGSLNDNNTMCMQGLQIGR